jgi:hypothetical protein
MTLSGIDPTTFRFVAQCLNHCATACPPLLNSVDINLCFFTSLAVQFWKNTCFHLTLNNMSMVVPKRLSTVRNRRLFSVWNVRTHGGFTIVQSTGGRYTDDHPYGRKDRYSGNGWSTVSCVRRTNYPRREVSGISGLANYSCLDYARLLSNAFMLIIFTSRATGHCITTAVETASLCDKESP